MSQSEDTLIHIDKSVLKKIRELAKKEKRTIKATLEIVIEEYFKHEETI